MITVVLYHNMLFCSEFKYFYQNILSIFVRELWHFYWIMRRKFRQNIMLTKCPIKKLITQKFKRGTKLFLTFNKTTIEKIRFATNGTVLNFVHFIRIRIQSLNFKSFVDFKYSIYRICHFLSVIRNFGSFCR